MQWCESDQDFDLSISFLVDGEFVAPTVATLTVRDGAGVPIPALTSVALPTGLTTVSHSILGSYNSITNGGEFEDRWVEVKFTADGVNRSQFERYRIAPFLPTTVTAQTVREVLGLSGQELPDDAVDIFGAYLALKQDYSAIFPTALTAGDHTTDAANRAIALKAALDLTSSLVFRVAIKIKAEDTSVDRMSEFDVDQIARNLEHELTRVLNVASGVTSNTTKTILSLATPTDVITGE